MRELGCPSKQFEGHLQFPLFFKILLANIGKKFALGGCKVGEVSFVHLFHFFLNVLSQSRDLSVASIVTSFSLIISPNSNLVGILSQ